MSIVIIFNKFYFNRVIKDINVTYWIDLIPFVAKNENMGIIVYELYSPMMCELKIYLLVSETCGLIFLVFLLAN